MNCFNVYLEDIEDIHIGAGRDWQDTRHGAGITSGILMLIIDLEGFIVFKYIKCIMGRGGGGL